MIGVLSPLEARQTAEIAARKALDIDNEVAEAHAALGYVNYFDWNWATAEDEFKRSIELNPGYASAHSHYAFYLAARGRIDEALAEINRAQELDPLSLSISSNRGFILGYGDVLYERLQFIDFISTCRKCNMTDCECLGF